jgi:hypothetical protein
VVGNTGRFTPEDAEAAIAVSSAVGSVALRALMDTFLSQVCT